MSDSFTDPLEFDPLSILDSYDRNMAVSSSVTSRSVLSSDLTRTSLLYAEPATFSSLELSSSEDVSLCSDSPDSESES